MKNLFYLLLAVLCFACEQEIAEPSIESRSCEFNYLSIETHITEKDGNVILNVAPRYIGGNEWGAQRMTLRLLRDEDGDGEITPTGEDVVYLEIRNTPDAYTPGCEPVVSGLSRNQFSIPLEDWNTTIKVIQIRYGDQTQSITKVIN